MHNIAFILCFGLLPLGALAEDIPLETTVIVAPISPTSVLKSPTTEKPLLTVLTVDQYLGHRDDIAAYTEFTADLDLKLNTNNEIEVVQALDRNTNISVTDREYTWVDTKLFHFYVITKDFHSVAIKWRNSLTLPASKASQDQGLIAAPAVRVSFSKSFFGDVVVLGYRPTFRYNFNQFTTSLSGTPVKKMILGHSLLGTFNFSDKLQATALAASFIEWNEATAFQTKPETSGGSYEFEGVLLYQINSYLSPHIGVDQADATYKEGRFDVSLYHPANTRYFVGLDLSF